MKHSDNIRVSIPKPCHEDWNKMTPNEKGAFCMKCAKTVVDFTEKSPEEIKNTLLEQSGKKVCGRFKNEQLSTSAPSSFNLNIPLYLLPKNLSRSRAFAIALFFVFGTSLFSCTTSQGHLVGKIAVDTTVYTKDLTTRGEVAIVSDTNKVRIEPVQLKGNVKCDPVKGDVAAEPMMLGEAVALPADTVKQQIKPDSTIQHEPKMGKIKIYRGNDE